MTKMEDDKIENDQNERQSKWKITKMEGDQNGRQQNAERCICPKLRHFF